MDALYSMVRDVTVFLILVAVVRNLFASKEYRKYLSLFTGMVLILIVLGPLTKLVKGDEILDYHIQMSSLAMNNSDLEHEITVADGEMKQEVIANYRDEIRKQVENIFISHQLYLKKMVIEMNEEEESDQYGSVSSMSITATKVEQEVELESEIEEVEDIEIENIRINEEGEVEQIGPIENASASVVTEQIQKELSSLYQVEEAVIQIRILP